MKKIIKYKGIIVECDHPITPNYDCWGSENYTDPNKYSNCIKQAREQGWKLGNGIICPNCSEKLQDFKKGGKENAKR